MNQPDRLPAAAITDEQLGALYDDRDRLGYEVQQWKSTYGEHALRDTLARLHDAEMAVTKLRAMHKPRTERHGSGCVQCGIVWPCPTSLVLDGKEAGRG